MKTIFTFFALLLNTTLFGQSLEWSTQVNEMISSFHVTSDPNGNVYTTGWFNGTADFDPGPGVSQLTSTGACCYVSKLDASGNFKWAVCLRKISGLVGSNGRYDITTDPSGNVYVTGFFSGTVDFDPGSGVFAVSSFTNSVYNDQFIWKLSTNGDLVWVKHIPPEIYVNSCTTDASGNLFAVGTFTGTADFGWSTNATTYSSHGVSDGFISKFDPAGNLLSVQQFGYSGGYSQLYSLSFGNSSYLQVTGSFSIVTDADPGPGTHILSGAGEQYFTANISSLGFLISAVSIISPAGSTVSSVLQDVSGNIYVAGQFTGTCDFDPTSSVYTLQASPCGVFAYKLDPAGNFNWAREIELPVCQSSNPILKSDASANIYLAGSFNGNIDVDPGPGTHSLTSSTSMNFFICTLNSSSNFISAIAIPNGVFDVDASGNIYYIFFGYTAKYSTLFTGIANNYINDLHISIFPNPGNGQFTLKNDPNFGKGNLEIYNVSGQKVYEQKIDSESSVIDLKTYDSGIYLLRLTGNDNRAWQKRLIKE